jgi:hypothetical protein
MLALLIKSQINLIRLIAAFYRELWAWQQKSLALVSSNFAIALSCNSRQMGRNTLRPICEFVKLPTASLLSSMAATIRVIYPKLMRHRFYASR